MLRLAVFDFCETLVDFQTADAFVDFVRHREQKKRMIFLNRLHIFLEKFRFFRVMQLLQLDNSYSKRIKLFQLCSIQMSTLEDYAEQFYNQIVKNRLIHPAIEELKQAKRDGLEIVLLSASYSLLLKYFAREFEIQHVISNVISNNSQTNMCKGIIDGKDCFGKEKVKRLDEHFSHPGISYEVILAYSDSKSDLPMLEIADEKIVISKEKSQNWAKIMNIKEIIWR
jgi:HAD superfamily hydrolase (TIGR01490 family)